MTVAYLWLLRRAHLVLRWLMKRCDKHGWLWAELADRDGHIAFRQIDYAERVQKASGWEPVEVHGWRPPTWTITGPTQPTFTTTTGTDTTVRYLPGRSP